MKIQSEQFHGKMNFLLNLVYFVLNLIFKANVNLNQSLVIILIKSNTSKYLITHKNDNLIRRQWCKNFKIPKLSKAVHTKPSKFAKLLFDFFSFHFCYLFISFYISFRVKSNNINQRVDNKNELLASDMHVALRERRTWENKKK